LASAPDQPHPLAADSREIVELDPARVVTEIALRAPSPWYMDLVHCGEVAPAFRPPGQGMALRLHQHPETYDQWEARDYEVIAITVMSGGYEGAKRAALSSGEAPAALLQEWQGRPVFIWRNRRIETWPSYEDDIRAALAAAASGELVVPEGSEVAFGPAAFGEIHYNADLDDDYLPHGVHYEGTVTDRATGQALPFSLHFMHPLFGHLTDMNGRDVLAVYTNRFVAIVPAEDLQPPRQATRPMASGPVGH
jgi:hypothetical protein